MNALHLNGGVVNTARLKMSEEQEQEKGLLPEIEIGIG